MATTASASHTPQKVNLKQMIKTKKEKVVNESEKVKALRTLFAAQKLSTPLAYEAQRKDEELERRIKEL